MTAGTGSTVLFVLSGFSCAGEAASAHQVHLTASEPSEPGWIISFMKLLQLQDALKEDGGHQGGVCVGPHCSV